jgi:hypothetical protein
MTYCAATGPNQPDQTNLSALKAYSLRHLATIMASWLTQGEKVKKKLEP